MSDHLPECPQSKGCQCPWMPECDDCGCICDRLRACEQRVRLENDDYAYIAAQTEADGRRRGWNEALDAAREAVAAVGVRKDTSYDMRVQALAAIDALRTHNP